MESRLKVLIVLWCGLSLGWVFAQPAGLLDQGDRFQREGRLDDALVAWNEFKQQHPDRLAPYLRTAEALLQAGRQHDASAELREALGHPPDSTEEAVRLAEAISKVGNVGIAVGVLEAASRNASLDAAGVWLLADLYYRQRRFDEALATLERYRNLPGADIEQAALRKGMVLLEKGALEESMEAFEAAVQRDPNLAAGFHGLSKVCQYGNNPEAALRMSREAVRLEPNNGIYLFQLGVVLKVLGQDDEAIRRLKEAETNGAEAFGISFELGDALRRTGRTGEAREVLARYQSLLRERRSRQEALQMENQGREQMEKGDVDGARRTFTRLAEEEPDNWTAHEHLAKIGLSMAKREEAWSQIQKMLELDPLSSEAHFLAALHWADSGRREEALREALEARRLRPGNAPLRNLLGNLYFQQRDWPNAVREYAAASALAPSDAAFKANLESARRRLDTQ